MDEINSYSGDAKASCKSKRKKLNLFYNYNGWKRVWVKAVKKKLLLVCGSDLWKQNTQLKSRVRRNTEFLPITVLGRFD